MPEMLEERELIRKDLAVLAECIRRKYGWPNLRIREYLHEIIDTLGQVKQV